MCCGNKKKKLEQKPVSDVKSGVVVNQPVGVTGPVVATQPIAVSNPGVPAYNPMGVSAVGRSRLAIDKKLEKSQVKVQEIVDPSITGFFKDCKTQRIDLTKITGEHNSYVRQHDYFDLSAGHKAELENVRGGDLRAAMYNVSDSSTLSTPSVNKFYYDRNVTDVGFVPHTQAYKTTYTVPVYSNAAGTMNTGQTVTYSSNVQGYNNPSYNSNVPGYTSNVQPYDSRIGSERMGDPSGFQSGVQRV